MRYVARRIPSTAADAGAGNPLQSVCYGESLDSLREWARTVLAAAADGARVDVYERVEVKRMSFVKEKTNVVTVVLEGTVVPAGQGGGAAPPVAQSGDAGAARQVARAGESGPEGK